MDLPLTGIYAAAFRGIRSNLLVYLLLLGWSLAGVVILLALGIVGTVFLPAFILAAFGSTAQPSIVIYLTFAYLSILALVMTVLSAATRAGVLAFGAKIRSGEKPTALDFFTGILRYTWQLFIGGIVVGMLTAIPALVFLLVARYSLSGIVPDIFTSGWNYSQSFKIIGYMWNMMLVAGAFHLVIFFWIAPWDEMVVLYKLRYSEALLRSFTFVFSRRHFLRVLGVVFINVIIAQLIILLTNIGFIAEGLAFSPGSAYFSVMINASSNNITAIVQAIFFPLFAYAQLFLLTWPQTDNSELESE